MTRNLTLTLGLITALALGLTALGPTFAADTADAPAAPDFTLKDHEGNDVTLSEVGEDKVVVLEWHCLKCPFVVRHHKEGNRTMADLATAYQDQGVAWLAVRSSHFGSVEANNADVQAYNIPYPLLDDHTGEVGQAYGAKTTPHMFIIKGGKILYNGAIDNDKAGNKPADERVNYVKQALDEILAGQTVSTPKTQPYGCSVKYKK